MAATMGELQALTHTFQKFPGDSTAKSTSVVQYNTVGLGTCS